MRFKVENWKLLVLSIFYFIFAILSYTIEKEKFLNFFQIAGILIVLIGLFQILVYFFKKDYMKSNEFSFSFGVLYCMAGLIVASKPDLIVDHYPMVISGLVVLDSTLRLQFSMNLLRLNDSQSKIHIACAVLPIIIGMCIILVPFEEHTLHNIFSFLLILDGIANFYTVLYYKRIVKRYGSRSDEIIDLSSQEEVKHEVIDGKDHFV